MPCAISNKDEKLHFALPKSEGWVSGSCANVKNDERNLDFNNMIEVDARAVSSIMKELQHKKIDLLKLDIEGSEFDVLEDILNSDIDVMQMCIDFHDHMLKQGKKRLGKIMSLLKKEYVIFDVERKSHHICCIRKDIHS